MFSPWHRALRCAKTCSKRPPLRATPEATKKDMVMVRNPGSETKQSPFKNLCQKNAKFSHPPGIGAVRILRSVKSTISISSPSIWKTLLSRTSKSMRYVLNSSRSHVRCTVRGTQGCHSPFTFTMSSKTAPQIPRDTKNE